MQGIRRTGMSLAVIATLLVPVLVRAQSRSDGSDLGSESRAQALVNVDVNRATIVRETVDRWRSELAFAIPSQNIADAEVALTAALERATAEKLLAASQAQTYEGVLAALHGPRQAPSVIALTPGSIPKVLGDTGDDLVFTPITPCRIVDTRIATGGWAGKVGPNSGNWYSVNLADFTAQGGASSCPGMPTSFNPGGVAINVTSTGQTGAGNLRVVACGAGTPTVSLLNYTPGVNLANAAVVSSAVGTCSLGPPAGAGPNDIFVYSGVSASDVIIDIMGYFAPPVATALDVTTVTNAASIAAGASQTLQVLCPAGRTATGGGCNFASFSSPLYMISTNPFSTGWNCAVQNRGGSADTLTVYALCGRVPGR
jgi:hypothetical protein